MSTSESSMLAHDGRLDFHHHHHPPWESRYNTEHLSLIEPVEPLWPDLTINSFQQSWRSLAPLFLLAPSPTLTAGNGLLAHPAPETAAAFRVGHRGMGSASLIGRVRTQLEDGQSLRRWWGPFPLRCLSQQVGVWERS